MRKKANCILTDTETINDFKYPLVHDMGWTVLDKEFNKKVSRRYLVEEFHRYGNPLLNNNEFYGGKKFLYDKAKKENSVEMLPFNEIIEKFFDDVKTYKVTCVCAYNLAFDDRAIKATYAFFNNGENEKFCEKFDRLSKLCIYKLATDTILNTDDYRQFATENGLVSDSGNYSTTAESCYRFIKNDTDYIEEHTALADVFDETEILSFICHNVKGSVTYGLYYNCWRTIQK
jgi:hypothetical protein